jgi:hypothetical protein
VTKSWQKAPHASQAQRNALLKKKDLVEIEKIAKLFLLPMQFSIDKKMKCAILLPVQKCDQTLLDALTTR